MWKTTACLHQPIHSTRLPYKAKKKEARQKAALARAFRWSRSSLLLTRLPVVASNDLLCKLLPFVTLENGKVQCGFFDGLVLFVFLRGQKNVDSNVADGHGRGAPLAWGSTLDLLQGSPQTQESTVVLATSTRESSVASVEAEAVATATDVIFVAYLKRAFASAQWKRQGSKWYRVFCFFIILVFFWWG